ncbi:MAG: hypothetical protein KGI38_11885 [Thaumarchaeota archaeon]|nr:hypothetical protein [Nitrososphaerota archaeon]
MRIKKRLGLALSAIGVSLFGVSSWLLSGSLQLGVGLVAIISFILGLAELAS